jgi:hypothetical protein
MKPVGCNTIVPNDPVQMVVVDLAVLDYLSKKLSLLLLAERLHLCYLSCQESSGIVSVDVNVENDTG